MGHLDKKKPPCCRIYPSKFFSALQLYCPRLLVVLLLYHNRTIIIQLDRRKIFGRVQIFHVNYNRRYNIVCTTGYGITACLCLQFRLKQLYYRVAFISSFMTQQFFLPQFAYLHQETQSSHNNLLYKKTLGSLGYAIKVRYGWPIPKCPFSMQKLHGMLHIHNFITYNTYTKPSV